MNEIKLVFSFIFFYRMNLISLTGIIFSLGVRKLFKYLSNLNEPPTCYPLWDRREKKNPYTSASASQSATVNSINFTTTKASEALLPPTHIFTHSCERMVVRTWTLSTFVLACECYASTHIQRNTEERNVWWLLLLCQMWWFCLSLLCHNKAHKSCCNHHTDTQKITHTNTLQHSHTPTSIQCNTIPKNIEHTCKRIVLHP